jgi:hypothetical protein
MKCPCEGCICIPICKHKNYLKLFGDCIYLRIYEPFYGQLEKRDYKRMKQIQTNIKPTQWYLFERTLKF